MDTDYLRASNGSGEAVRCIVIDPRGIGDMVFNNTTPTNWNNYFIAMAGKVDPATDRFIEGEYVVFKGHLAGSAITIDELAPGYTDIGNSEDDIIVIKPTTLWADIVADTMDTVTQAIIDAEAATAAATAATTAANTAAGSANTAAGNANTATTAANTATGLANTATTNANTATTAANTATGNANTATTAANAATTAATNAANATKWTQGTAVPTGGFDGNFYLRTTTYDVYQKIAGTWTIVANIKGATGATGSTGAAGADGKTIVYGTAAPTTEGNNGDFYIRTTTNFIYGPKAAGVWPSGVSLVGPTGATGSTGAAGTNGSTWYNGSGAPSAGTGVNGDYYWDSTNYKVYNKASGSWSLISTISSSDANAIKIDGSATVTANIPFNAHKLTGVTDPTSAQDAATKAYVDALPIARSGMSTVSGNGNIAITTLPFQPSVIVFYAYTANGAGGSISSTVSFGTYDRTSGANTSYGSTAGAAAGGGFPNTSTYCIDSVYVDGGTSAGRAFHGAVSATSSTGFTVTITDYGRAGSFFWIAYR